MVVQPSRMMLMGCSGSATGAATPPTLPSGIGRYGGAAGSYIVVGLSPTTIQYLVGLWAADGATVLRIDCLDQASFQTNFGYAVTACEANAMKVIATLRGVSSPYANTGLAANFAHRMAVAWGDRIAIWEYVNEPNLPYAGNNASRRYPNPAVYGAELAAVYTQLKNDLPDCFVATCGMGYDGSGSFSGWWPGALAGGASGHFDIMNLHLYNDPSQGNWTEGLALQDEGKPVIVTEAGSTSSPTAITNAMNDGSIELICIYTMLQAEDPAWAIFGTSRETAYKAVTGA